MFVSLKKVFEQETMNFSFFFIFQLVTFSLRGPDRRNKKAMLSHNLSISFHRPIRLQRYIPHDTYDWLTETFPVSSECSGTQVKHGRVIIRGKFKQAVRFKWAY